MYLIGIILFIRLAIIIFIIENNTYLQHSKCFILCFKNIYILCCISRFQLITKTYKLLCRFLNIFVHNAYFNKNYLFEWHVISLMCHLS